MLAFVIFIVVVALIFDFLNGMNDAANSIATVVSTRVLSPRLAVLWAAFFNLAAAFFFGVHVATTIGKGVVDPGIVDAILILSTLCAAIFWTYICTYIGLPISVSHALVGGLVGSGIAKAGLEALVWSGLLKIAVFIAIAPLLGTILGYAFMVAVYWICRHGHPQRIDRWFRRLQLISAAAYSLGHGTNDAQKTMGIITVLLYSTGYLKGEFHVPFWVVLLCHVAIALGTLAGGWRVIETLGMKMTKIKPVHGFCAETAAASSILLSTVGGIPVSTTHTITGAIIGVGATTKLSAVRWGVAANIVIAWLLTIPTTAVISSMLYSIFKAIGAI